MIQTLAGSALDTLKRRLVTVEDNGCFNSYDHVMFCHGCGAFHAVRSAFISSPLVMGFKFSDGSSVGLACHKCPTCPGQEIRDAWEQGIRRSVINKAAQEIGAELLPDLVPCKLCGTLGVPGYHIQPNGKHELCGQRAARALPTPPLPMPKGLRQ